MHFEIKLELDSAGCLTQFKVYLEGNHKIDALSNFLNQSLPKVSGDPDFGPLCSGHGKRRNIYAYKYKYIYIYKNMHVT